MIMLELTPNGRLLLEQLLYHIIAHISQLLNPLSDSELVTIQNGMVALQKVFPPLEPWPKE
jgi:hypothetical protein